MTPIGGINPAWYHVANAFSLFVNDRAHAEQRRNQGDLKLR